MKAPKKSPNKPPKFATALVPFETLGEAFAVVCASGQERRGLGNIEATWASGQEPAAVKRLKSQTNGVSNGSVSSSEDLRGPARNTVNLPGLDFESETLMRMRQAERERLEQELREQEAAEEI